MAQDGSKIDDDAPVPGVAPYDGPAGGWGALRAVAVAIKDQMGASADTRALLQMNQPDGFDCPGCAWPDPRHTSSFEFCENGAKAVTWEATPKRVDPDFFASHSVSDLWDWSDHRLEDAGRLTHPLRYDPATDHYVPIGWDEAMAQIGAGLNALDHADRAEFYCSGRASNEAAFLYQLFARAFGTNNFPDCSNMCHEATSVGLAKSIGLGKGSVTLEDFDHADAIFCIGHNPGTNHPRMLSTLAAAAKRGAPIIVANPMRERGLERFKSPQHPTEMLAPGATRLASAYHQVRVGGKHAVVGYFEALRAEVEAQDWAALEQGSGLTRAAMESMAQVYAKARNVIICYGMGITQHRHGTQNVQQIANLLLLRGNFGRPGAGICPLRGHSNATAPSASPKHPAKTCWPGLMPASASPARANMAITRSMLWRRWHRARRARSSRWAAISPSPCPTRRPVSPPSANSTWPSTSSPNSTAPACSPRAKPSSCPALAAPNSTCRRAARNGLRWKTACRWSTPRAGGSSQPRTT